MATKPGQDNIRYEVITQESDDGDLIIPLPMPLLKSLGWKEGDDVTISIDDEGKIYLKKADK
jgi:bifunctional DNA-binding transcriptional regulator/antitoxin component of YhaV-PrlF toxin-antitoxin module